MMNNFESDRADARRKYYDNNVEHLRSARKKLKIAVVILSIALAALLLYTLDHRPNDEKAYNAGYVQAMEDLNDMDVEYYFDIAYENEVGDLPEDGMPGGIYKSVRKMLSLYSEEKISEKE